MKEETEIIIMCPPVVVSERIRAMTGLDKVTPTAGAIAGTCDGCGRAIWIGPKSQEAMSKATKVLCMICGIPHARSSGGEVIPLGGKGSTYHMEDGSTIG